MSNSFWTVGKSCKCLFCCIWIQTVVIRPFDPISDSKISKIRVQNGERKDKPGNLGLWFNLTKQPTAIFNLFLSLYNSRPFSDKIGN